MTKLAMFNQQNSNDMKEQIIDKLDFTEDQYEEARTPEMLPFSEMIDNAIKENAIKEFEAIDKNG